MARSETEDDIFVVAAACDQAASGGEHAAAMA
jgi:hypothetical protein